MSRPDDFEPDELDGEEPLSPEEQAELESALRAALSPHELDPEVHERILERALSDPLAPASPEERTHAERLRSALESPEDDEVAALAQALRFAYRAEPTQAAEAAHERALGRALPRRTNVVYVLFGAAGGALALAAAVALVLTPLHKQSPPGPERTALARSRSLAPLLNVEAPRLTPSERIDRIASVRERDLRNNRYARWGLR